ncbi:HAD family hydrolase [Thermocoleostomius sinensis]|uniref:HAD family hydrolase n=1 Tax=Thermocoleostomius sinensis A174 TaxID=2016057 RepID=A0A9E8ZAR8_9CYAN|nr:HAD family hydrolase [Thermocoleostomius sinensis]WAL58544.1 HAD family hydrolase [Thermocoleostomius sinensis A174]
MLKNQPAILALDFDGVVCDGLIEYFQTAWQAYCQLWKPAETVPPQGLDAKFYRLRPVVESGWEMPVLIQTILDGLPEAEILAHWGTLASYKAQEANLTPIEIAATVDRVRDEWISRDVDHWLSQHQFYPGIIARIQQMLADSIDVVIITTKEGRFVRQLLQQQQIDLPENCIFGKEVKQPKSQTLRDLLSALQQGDAPTTEIWFVEDRLKTLQAIQAASDLDRVQLFLADWGYNTPYDRELADRTTGIHLLSLSTFVQAFSQWY